MTINHKDLSLVSHTIKTLAMDAVQKANSGHPGMPMGCSDIAAVLWTKYLKHNSQDSEWVNRDRFILSAGHGSMLLYSMLHLSGYDVTIEDLKEFRQLDSKTPGHPEHFHTHGVETTTGPLGQGFANGVGMGIASSLLSKEFNIDGSNLINHYIYAIVSDGDLMEGVSSEAASLAGHMGIGNLIYIYDYNNISIEGSTDLAYTEDVAKRFEAYGWHVQDIDGHNFDEISSSIEAAQEVKDRPSIIIAHTVMAKGSATMEHSEGAHGAPLGEDEVAETKKKIGCNEKEFFAVSERVYEIFKERNAHLVNEYDLWNELFTAQIKGEMKKTWDAYFGKPDMVALKDAVPVFETGTSIATRSASGKILEKLFPVMPNLVGGSADLAPSNKSFVKGFSETGKGFVGRNMHFGVREHAMGSIQNGIAYYGGFVPYSATFFVFMDYMRPPVRLAALGHLHSVYVFTHDSIFVGEDGPTHQPVEHLAAARAIPNLTVIRPADASETAQAWLQAIERTDGPTALCLTRQNLPVLEQETSAEDLAKGAYVVHKGTDKPDMILYASGSEVHVAVEVAETLSKEGKNVRVVSFPSWELFEAQDAAYQNEILPTDVPKGVVEAGRKFGWEQFVGRCALFITIESFGASAPAKDLTVKFGLSVEQIVEKVKRHLAEK